MFTGVALEDRRRVDGHRAVQEDGHVGDEVARLEAGHVVEDGLRPADGERGDEHDPAAPEGGPAYAVAIPLFARAVGAARDGRPEMARPDIDRLGVLESDLAASGEADWAVRVGAQRLAAEAWALWAEGDREQALETARRAAELESRLLPEAA